MILLTRNSEVIQILRITNQRLPLAIKRVSQELTDNFNQFFYINVILYSL